MRDVLAALSEGAVVCTANRRLAASLRDAFDEWQQQQGKKAWFAPEVLPLASWLSEVWRLHGNGAVPTSAVEDALWWEKAIRDDPCCKVLDVRGLAQCAMEAYSLLQEYALDVDDVLAGQGPDAEALRRWSRKVEGWLAQSGKISLARLPALVSEAVQKGCLPLPQRLMLAGFVEQSPALKRLLEDLRRQGVAVGEAGPAPMGKRLALWCLLDAEAEACFLAWRIRQIFKPGMRIGVVVPDLGARRRSLARILSQELDPAGTLNDADPVVDFSLGDPLAVHPTVQAGLLLLRFVECRDVEFPLLSALLRLPISPVAADERLRAELKCRRECLYRLPAGQWLEWLKSRAPQAAAWLGRLHAAADAGSRPPSSWVQSVESWLAAAGWPGEDAPDSVLREWRQVLHQLAGLDAVMGEVDWPQFRMRLEDLLASRIFRPEPAPADVRVMGLLEGVGQSFDHLFVLGMHDKAWPQPAHPHPLLPVALQRAHGMPHADARREFRYAEAVWEALMRTAPAVEVMYPAFDERGAELGPSPLLADWPQQNADEPPSLRPGWVMVQKACTLQDVDASRLSLSAGERLSGGTQLLAAQSDCPFKAFAGQRLQLEPLHTPPLGIDPQRRGTIVHAALHRLWSALGDQRALVAAVNEGALDGLIQSHVADAVRSNAPVGLDAARRRLEEAAVKDMLDRWLQLEIKRPAFVVQACEKKVQLPIGPLTLSLRLDRVDEEAAGRCIVLDYKTGQVSAAKWQGERPADPQMPAYALAADAAAVAYAVLRLDEMRFVGLGEDALLPGVKACGDWPGQRQAWRQALTALASEFADGVIAVKPRDDQVCRYCPFADLCRIREYVHATA